MRREGVGDTVVNPRRDGGRDPTLQDSLLRNGLSRGTEVTGRTLDRESYRVLYKRLTYSLRCPTSSDTRSENVSEVVFLR